MTQAQSEFSRSQIQFAQICFEMLVLISGMIREESQMAFGLGVSAGLGFGILGLASGYWSKFPIIRGPIFGFPL